MQRERVAHIPRNEANPARWRGHLDKLLAKRQKLTRGHALEFLILTVAALAKSLARAGMKSIWNIAGDATESGAAMR